MDRNASLPFEPSSTVKKLSSIEVVVALPPSSAASAGWLNGTTKRYCAAVPSMYWLVLVGVMPLTNAPLVSFGLSSLLAGLKTFFQLLARLTIAAAVDMSLALGFGAASRNRDSAKSAWSYSSWLDRNPCALQQP